MKSPKSAIILFIIIPLVFSQAYAVTPKIFLEDRSKDEQSSYLFGALEMAISINSTKGNDKKSDCILNWFAGNVDEANQELINTVHHFKDGDFPVAAIILMLIDRHCGNAETSDAQSQPQSE